MTQPLSPAAINFSICNGLAIYKSADWSIPVQVSERSVTKGSISDEPVDLTGCTGTASIKRYCGADQAIAIPTVEITDPENGMILISLSAEETAGIPAEGNTWNSTSQYVYDVYITDEENGESYRILMGSVEVSPSATDGDDN